MVAFQEHAANAGLAVGEVEENVSRNSSSLLRTPAWLMTFVCSGMSTQFVTLVKNELEQLKSKGACIGVEQSNLQL